MGILSAGDSPNAVPQRTAEHDHPLVGPTPVLERVNRDRALRHLRVPVPGVALALSVGPVSGLAHEVDHVLADLRLRCRSPWDRRLGLKWRTPKTTVCVSSIGTAQRETEARVNRRSASPSSHSAAVWPKFGKDGVVGPDPDVVFPALGGDVHHAVRGRAEVVFRHRAPGFGELHTRDAGVEKYRVHRVHHVLVQLQPVARMPEREGDQAVVGLLVGVEVRERRNAPRRSQVREDETAELSCRVRALRDGVPDRALVRLARGLEDHPVDVEQPAVVAAADPALRDDAELERRSAVAAVPVQDPDPALQIAEHDEVLAQDAHRERYVAELRGERHRLPVTAKQLATRSPGADMGQLFVLGRNVRT